MRFRFIATEKATFPVRMLCRTLQVSRAGFYAWQRRAPAARTKADAELGRQVATIHAQSRRCYGSPRIRAELVEILAVNAPRFLSDSRMKCATP